MSKRILLSKICNYDSIIIFGCGKYGKIIFKYLKKLNMDKKVTCFADNRNKFLLKFYKQKKILYPNLAQRKYKDSLWIISSPKNSLQMLKQLQNMQIPFSDILQPTEDNIQTIYKYVHKYWYYEDKNFMYENGFPINLKFFLILLKSFFYGIYYDIIMRNSELIKNANKQYKYNVSICGIFLNEEPYMKEWIEFHKMVGVEHFYLYNNLSTDGYKNILTPYINEGVVTLIEWDIPHGQISAYWDCVMRFSQETKWIGFIDLDEFVVPRKSKIYDFLRQYDNGYGSVLVYSKIYGSSGIRNRNLEGLVTEDFKKCWPKLENLGKCFYNTAYKLSSTEKNDLGFYHICWTRKKHKDIPPINIYGKFSLPGGLQRASKKKPDIQINHYLTKSYQEYRKKIMQSDATFEKNPRTNSTFIYFDKKSIGTDNLIDQYIPELKRRLKEKGDI